MKNKLSVYFRAMRLHQPIGIFLLLWPCLIGLSMANRGFFTLKYTLIFTLGSILMRSAGCIINDIIDYDLDSKVFRTKNRPITSGELNFKQANYLLVILLACSALLLCFLNKYAIMICLFSIVLVVIYPFLKRFTYFPQILLGFTFNIGSLVAWVTVRNQLDFPALILYVGLIFWTIGYDTIYAHQDRDDDIKIGVKSTAIYFYTDTGKYLNLFYTIAATMFCFAGNLSGIGFHYNALLFFPIIILFWQVRTIDIYDSKNCNIRFKSNFFVGATLYLAVILTRYLS